MFLVDDYIVYKRRVCKIIHIKEKYMKGVDYYELIPKSDPSLKILVPCDSKEIKPLITREKVEEIISKIPEVAPLSCDDRHIENEYQKLFYTENYEDLICIIKTTYLRNKKRKDENKKCAEKDDYYFEKAEHALYEEFSVVLDMEIEKVRDYIIQKVTKS